jgi:hypothetical protein
MRGSWPWKECCLDSYQGFGYGICAIGLVGAKRVSVDIFGVNNAVVVYGNFLIVFRLIATL